MMADGTRGPSFFRLDGLLAGLAGECPVPPVWVGGLCHDSRRIRPEDLFVALAGHRSHGLCHAAQAVDQGCAAIAYDPAGGGAALAAGISEIRTPCIPVKSLGQKLGSIADRFYGEPSRGLDVLAVTGTNGKTSTTHFLAQALSALHPAAVIGTLGWGVPGSLRETTHTTPDAIEVHQLLAKLRSEGFRTVAMEASSHGQVQGRLNGVRFKGVLYTNFSRDHLDYHGTMEAYLEAKLRLLACPGLEFAVFNADDVIAAAVRAALPEGVKAFAFSAAGACEIDVPLVRVSDVRHGDGGVAFRVSYGGEQAEVEAPVFGDFNVENVVAALTGLLALGLDLREAAESLRRVRAVPGRMESFMSRCHRVVVDYAHTPDALASVLGSLRRHCRGRLCVVFGCGGDRDRGKRPEMGAIAGRLADVVVLTDDNPRSEDGDAIIRDILAGCGRSDTVTIRDRRAAIAWAIGQAGADDLVLVAGKGHETTQEVRGEKFPFSDRQVVPEILAGSGAPP